MGESVRQRPSAPGPPVTYPQRQKLGGKHVWGGRAFNALRGKSFAARKRRAASNLYALALGERRLGALPARHAAQ